MELADPFPLRRPVTFGSFSGSGVAVGVGFAEGVGDGDTDGEGDGDGSAASVGIAVGSAAAAADGSAAHIITPKNRMIRHLPHNKLPWFKCSFILCI